MRPIGRALAGTVAVTALLAALVGVSAAPYPTGADRAWVRLSWRMAPPDERPACEPADAEALERLPVHMRGPGACRQRAAAYRLRVEIDGREVISEVLRGGGALGDRPVFVYRELAVGPGCRTVLVRFAQDLGGEGRQARGGGEGLGLTTRAHLDSREVALITLDRETGEPVVRARPCSELPDG